MHLEIVGSIWVTVKKEGKEGVIEEKDSNNHADMNFELLLEYKKNPI